jgi:hypothetical protein
LDEKVFPNRLSIPCIGMLKRMNEVFSKNKETIDIELINEEKEETDPLQDIELELSK